MTAVRKWIIGSIVFDDPELPPRVLKECIPADEDGDLAAFLRGAELLETVWENDEAVVEACRLQIERKCLR